jgi:hypothetical protein
MSTEQVIFLVVHSGKTEISKVGYGSAGHSSTGVGGQLAEVESRADRATPARLGFNSSEVDQELPSGKPISRFAKQPAFF